MGYKVLFAGFFYDDSLFPDCFAIFSMPHVFEVFIALSSRVRACELKIQFRTGKGVSIYDSLSLHDWKPLLSPHF
jgi:hypothetical protein